MDSTTPQVLLDDRGFPDKTVNYDWLEDRPSKPRLLRKTAHALPTAMDPNFNVQYNKAKHGKYLCKHLKVGHLEPVTAAQLTLLIKKYWCVFNPDGLQYPVIG